jgi:hypothetical protein
MRTTIDLDADLLRRLRAEANRRRVPFKHLLNRILREGLEAPGTRAAEPYRCPTFALGRPNPDVDLDKALGIAAALEDEAVSAKLAQRK